MALLKIDGDASGALRSIQQIERALGGIQTSAASASRGVSSLSTSLGGIAAAVVGSSLFNFIDGLQNMQNKLRIATSSVEEFNLANGYVKAIADKTGQSLTAIGDLYAAVSRNASKLGYDTAQVATVTNAMATALKASGASAQGSASTLYQFSQILAKGKVNGDEFTTIMENLGGPVMDLVAKNMGLTTAELMKLKEKGLVGAKDFTDALIKSMNELDSMGNKALPTLGQNLQRIQNSFADFVLKLDKATGFTTMIGNAMNWLAKNVDLILPLMAAFMGFFVAQRLLTFVAAMYEVIKVVRAFGVAAAITEALATGGLSAVTGLIGAAAAAAGAVLLFDRVDQSAESLNINLAATGDAAKAGLGETNGQLTGIAEKYQEILKEVNALLAVSTVPAQQLQIENQLLQYKKQLSDKMTEAQATELRGLLMKIEYNKQISVLNQDIAKMADEIALLGEKDLRVREVKQAILERERTIGQALASQDKDRLATKLKELQAAKDLDSINQSLASTNVPKSGAQAGVQVAGQMGALDPITAAMTANQTMFDGLKYLREQDLISEQQYQIAKVTAANTAVEQIMAANTKMFEAQKLYQLQNQTNTIFGYETQKTIAKDAAAFEMKSTYEKTQFGIEQAGSLFSSLGAQNKKAFEASKALNIASAIMNTYQGATKALATYPFPFGLIAAAGAVAAGMAQVSMIRSQQYSGRALGGPVMGGTPYLVGENGPEIFTPTNTGSITRNGDIGQGGSTTVNFNITANDTTGFDELLTTRKGLITQIIRDAQQERGQRVGY